MNTRISIERRMNEETSTAFEEIVVELLLDIRELLMKEKI